MPTYEYKCKECSHQFEIWQKMIDEPLTICPKCGGVIRRLLFPAGVVFKGSGFYKTDHANGSAAAENGHASKSNGAEQTKAGETAAASSSESKGSSEASGSKASEHKVASETKN